MKTFLIAFAWVVAAGCAQRDVDKRKDPPAADDTKKNARDRSDTVTPLDQKEDSRDIEITAEVRKELVGNHDLSMTAKNVKVVTRDGVVTLRGPVETDAEKATVHAAAQKVVGDQRVDDQIEIAPK
jgi:hyperosmotically inducible protein